MADIAWSAYALAMFTPEERAAAVNAVPEDPPARIIATPVVTQPNVTSTGLGLRITGPGIPASGYDPNKPSELQALYALGWRFEAGKWIAPGSTGQVATPDQVAQQTSSKGPGLSSVTGVSTFGSGSVLGVSVPAAPAVMLPTWVGGAIGHIIRSGGTRPESGGMLRIIKGEGHKYAWTKIVR